MHLPAQFKRDPVKKLIKKLQATRRAGTPKDYYYEIRRKDHLADPGQLDRAARFIYLNKTCYNGLWRVNSQGTSSTFRLGATRTPQFASRWYCLACSRAALPVRAYPNARLPSLLDAGAGDFVYFDPPYHPLDKTGFTATPKMVSAKPSKRALRDSCLELHATRREIHGVQQRYRIHPTLYECSF